MFGFYIVCTEYFFRKIFFMMSGMEKQLFWRKKVFFI